MIDSAMDAFEIYSKNSKIIDSIYRSRLSMQILIALTNANATLGKLREVTGSTSQALIPKIRRLQSLLLIESRGYEYTLTPLGKLVSSQLIHCILTAGVVTRYKEFWASHDLSGIPPEFLATLHTLFNSELMVDTPEDVVHIYTLFIGIVKDASHIYGISSVMTPGFADALSERIKDGTPVELVVSRDALEKLAMDQYVHKFKAALAYPNFKVWITDHAIKIGLTVTDKCLSLGFMKKDSDIYDSTSDLFSTDPAAVAWATQLFEHYRNRSTLLDAEAWAVATKKK